MFHFGCGDSNAVGDFTEGHPFVVGFH
jgi:hypothetical protein